MASGSEAKAPTWGFLGAPSLDHMEEGWLRSARVVAVLAALACASCSASAPAQPGHGLSRQKLEVAAVWSGIEQRHFEAVLRAFTRQAGISVTYTSAGYSVPAFLAARLAKGRPPDVAFLPQPGLLRRYAAEHRLVPLNGIAGSVVAGLYPRQQLRLVLKQELGVELYP